jgi:hypothetical protein
LSIFQSFSFPSPYGSQKLYNNTYNFTKRVNYIQYLQVYYCFRYAAILFKKQKYVSGQHKVSIIILFKTRYHSDLPRIFTEMQDYKNLNFNRFKKGHSTNPNPENVIQCRRPSRLSVSEPCSVPPGSRTRVLLRSKAL